jgi:small subunit ribosomal protein S16
MLKMRLQRVGRRHIPVFRLVLTDSKNSTKSGRFAEILGSYDPRKSTDAFNTERIKYWLDKGVGLTGTVHNLLVTHKVIDAKKINVLPKKTVVAKEVFVEAPTPVVEAAPETVPETPVDEVQPVVESSEAPTGEAA